MLFWRIAGPAEGFSIDAPNDDPDPNHPDKIGRSPGISDDGRTVAFFAENVDGPAIWISVLRPAGDPNKRALNSSAFADRQLLKIAGLIDELRPGQMLTQFGSHSRVGVGGELNDAR